jgi:predicted kinase
MKRLIVMVGLPRSGKTTWAKQSGHPIVNRDSIRFAMYEQRYIAAAEEIVTAIETTMVKALFLAGHDTVIVDACHMTPKRRRRWESDEWSNTYKLICTSEKVCITRADQTLIPVIQRMAKETDITLES